MERDGVIWLQELKARRPLTDPIRREEPKRTTRSAGQPQPHLVIYTNPNKVKLAVISTSPDQQQYEDPARAWRRILQQQAIPPPTQPKSSDHISTPASPANHTPTHRQRGRPSGSANQCSKPKALQEVKACRTDPTLSFNHTVTASQPYPNDAVVLSHNTTPRQDGASNQNNDSGELNTDIGT